MQIFDQQARTDRSPRKADEPMFAFLNRCGASFFDPVRDLLQTWLDKLPAEAHTGVVGDLRSGEDAQFESAFWELYLYQLVAGTGVDISVHPDVPGISKHPDFLVHADRPFYLEAVSVGSAPQKIAQQRRLRSLEAILDEARAVGWTLSMSWHEIGPRAMKSKQLRDDLLNWLHELNADGRDEAIRQAMANRQFQGTIDPPTFQFDKDGWELEFAALPVVSERAPLVGIRGAARGAGVDNSSGLRRVLRSKAHRYGESMPHPLVTAVLSNTEVPTRLYQIQPVLFGLHPRGPSQVTDFSELAEDGHWRTRRGWRRAHNPYVLVGCDIHPYSIHRRSPMLWHTLDPDVDLHLDLPWAAPVDLTVAEPADPTPTPQLASLGIDAGWCSGKPEFEE